MDCVSDNSSSREAINELTVEGAHSPLSTDALEMNTSIGSELEELEDSVQEKTDSDSDTVLGTQPRYHFSRQPVKYIRTQAKMKPVIPFNLPLRSTTLANMAMEPGAEGNPTTNSSSPTKDILEESTRSSNSVTDTSTLKQRLGGRQQLKHFEITQETARIVSKFKVDDASASPEPFLESTGSTEKAEDLNLTYL